ncbi:MAG: M3 family oligoendopeptidase, partial [Bacteroidetes bacterium]|nr:M3 family oligoendopeptidase [Bacteroidota bacterium]
MERFENIPYTRPNIQHIKEEFLGYVNQIKEAKNYGEQQNAIKEINKINAHVDTAMNIAYVRNSINTEDAFYDAEKSYFDENMPVISDLNFEYYKALNASKYRKNLEEEFGKQLFTIAEFSVKSFDKSIMDDLVEENKLSSEYSKLVASAQIEFDGKVLNLSQLTPYTQSADRAIRKKATEAKYDFVEKNSQQFDEIYDKLVKLRDKMAKKMGFKNYVELGYLKMQRSDYNPEMVS